MKTPFSHCLRTRSCLILIALANMEASSAWCGPSFGGTFRVIKERVVHVINKIRNGPDEDASSPHHRKEESAKKTNITNQRQPSKSDEQRRQESNTSDDSGHSASGLGRQRPAIPPASDPAAPSRNLELQPESSVGKPVPADGRTQATGKKDVSPLPSAPASPISYARPVPGHPGLVYAPGDAAELKNMLDVRGCQTGRTMLDPRSGKKFLVP